MDDKLVVGDVFRTKRQLYGAVDWKRPSGEPFVNYNRLTPMGGGRVTCPWTEKGENGWERKREDVLETTAPEMGEIRWFVVKAALGGGGYGHGPGDYYPDVWQVEAIVEGDPSRKLRFCQGGNMDNISPADIELVEASKLTIREAESKETFGFLGNKLP